MRRRIWGLVVLILAITGCTPATMMQSSAGSGNQMSAAAQDSPSSGNLAAESTAQSEETELPEWQKLSVREQAASLLMLHFPGTDDQAASEFLDQVRPAGLILMGDNIPDPDSQLTEVTRLWQADPVVPYLVAIDQEGGVVSRINSDPAPGAEQLRIEEPGQVEQAFALRAGRLHELGINVNFGIVADYTEDPDSFIAQRVLGVTPDQAASRVAAAARGEDGLVLSTLKHFPNHGGAEGDSHTEIPESVLDYQQWLDSGAIPFQAGAAAGAELVMMGHLRFPSVDAAPASLSPKWHQIAREELGEDIVIVSDDLSMLDGNPEFPNRAENAVLALKAGTDLVLSVAGETQEESLLQANELIDGIVAAVESGDLPADRFESAVAAVWALRASLDA